MKQASAWFGLAPSLDEPPATGAGKPQLISESELRSAISSRGTIAVVRVVETQTRAEGMGHERVWIEATVERSIFGRAMRIECTRSGRYPGVVRGQRYAVAVSGSGELLAYAPVGDLERSVEGHRRLVERMIPRF